jgi:hypothetical protein
MGNFVKIYLFISALSLCACGGHQLRVKAAAEASSYATAALPLIYHLSQQ